MALHMNLTNLMLLHINLMLFCTDLTLLLVNLTLVCIQLKLLCVKIMKEMLHVHVNVLLNFSLPIHVLVYFSIGD